MAQRRNLKKRLASLISRRSSPERVALFSDIHANRCALDAARADAVERGAAEQFWCLGDVIGYGPEAGPCLSWLRNTVSPKHYVLGNHEAILAGHLDAGQMDRVGADAKWALEWQKPDIPDKMLQAWMGEEHYGPKEVEHGDDLCILVHDTLTDRLNHWEGYFYPWENKAKFPNLVRELSQLRHERGVRSLIYCYGHTHIPTLLTINTPSLNSQLDIDLVVPGREYPLGESVTIINPGSVGMPRDDNVASSYAVIDFAARTVTFHRVRYRSLTVNAPNQIRQKAARLEVTDQDGRQELRGTVNSIIERLVTAKLPSSTPVQWERRFQEAAKNR